MVYAPNMNSRFGNELGRAQLLHSSRAFTSRGGYNGQECTVENDSYTLRGAAPV
jgi:hypothetical protein